MAVDFSSLIYAPGQDFFGRDVTISPIASAPGAAAYGARGIYGTRDTQIMTDAGMAIVSDQQTILDIRDNEWFNAGLPLPIQGDLIHIPAEGEIPAEGDFEITDTSRNGGGETTLVIRKFERAEP